jgi:N-methylhydantoinase A/oxoprolinase/acetone carboxylase beta subunit
MSTTGEYVVGIDTGGTYTDAVLLDYRSRKVIAFSKTLTTRGNLTRGITTALKDLHIEDAGSVRLVGVSSTLATNSIAEGKERQAGLLLIGYDRDLIAAYDLSAKFPTTHWAHFRGGHTTQGLEKEPLDLESIREWVRLNSEKVDALAISGYFSPLNPIHEERALAVVRQTCSLPVVLGHHLSTKLDSIKRATTACLNASLVAVMQEFIEAVRQSLDNRGIHSPLMIVKGDGSLIPATEAIHKPVETVLSGPAASAIGGRFLSGQGNALVIDVGGTTTDLALVDDFKMTISEDGARVGMFETAVKAARIRTAGLGGDSRISIDSGGTVRVGPERVVPLSRLAALYPQVEQEICSLKKKRELDRRSSDLEYWFLHPENNAPLPAAINSRQQELVTLLKDGPLSLSYILKNLNIYHPLQLQADALIRQGIIEQATLTPTDLLHVTGQMDAWCVDAARQVVAYACDLFSLAPDTFAEETLDLVVARMAQEAIVFLGRQTDKNQLPEQIDDAWGKWLVSEAIAGKNPHLAVTIASRCPVIGIGAPAKIFIKRVAQLLNAPFILPEFAPVANAVGAVAGSVIVEKEAIVYARETKAAHAYVVQIEEDNTDFLEEEDAVDYAEQTVETLAREGAVTAGAVDPQVMVEKIKEGHLQRIVARGIGNPKL